MIKLTKSNKVRLIVCTLTALFVSLSFMGCPTPYGTDLSGTDTEQTETTETETTGTDSTTTMTTVDAADYKDFYVIVTGYDPTESYVNVDNKEYSDKAKNKYATRYTGIDGLDNLKEFIKQEIMKPENCGREEGNFITPAMTEGMFNNELQSLWESIDANYQTYNYIDIVWHEDHYNRDYRIIIFNIKM